MGIWHALVAVDNAIDAEIGKDSITEDVVVKALENPVAEGGLGDTYSPIEEHLDEFDPTLGQLLLQAIEGIHETEHHACYGPVFLLSSAEVKAIAEGLAAIDEEDDAYIMAEMLLPFYQTAADKDCAVLTMLN